MANIAILRKENTEKRENLHAKLDAKRVIYKFNQTYKNPNCREVSVVPFVLVNIRNNSSKNLKNFVTGRPVYDKIYGTVQRDPKWITILDRHETTKFKHMTIEGIYETNDLKASKYRMIKAVNKFCDYYEPLYQAKKVSILFFTFTRANYSVKTIATMLECVKSRLNSLKWHLRGYLWTLEAKENAKMQGGYHLHYHLVIAVDRVNINKIPEQLKLENIWGQRTGVIFITYSVRGYLSKYLEKENEYAKVSIKRRYGVSKKFI